MTGTSTSSVENFFKKAASETADFGEGLYHGAIESPVNGAIQLANHVAGSHLPELHLVDENRLSHSVGGVIGNMVGTAADMYALSVATAGVGGALGGSAMVGNALRFGAVGAAYTGLLQPTEANSQHFFRDRLTNGAVALGTYAAMGGAASALDKAGLFAVPTIRTLAGNLTYGSVVGAAGGLAHAETNAVFKEGNILPSLGGLAKDVGSYAVFGAAFGAANYAANRYSPAEVKEFKTSEGNAQVTFDKQGQPVKVYGEYPSVTHPGTPLAFEAKKLTNGTWTNDAWVNFGDKEDRFMKAAGQYIEKVNVTGNKLTLTGDGEERSYTDNGKESYKRINLEDATRQAQFEQQKAAYDAAHSATSTTNGVKTDTVYDDKMQVKNIAMTTAKGRGEADVYFDKEGKLNTVSVAGKDVERFGLSRHNGGNWTFQKNDQTFKYDGDVSVTQKTATTPEQIVLTPTGGKPTVLDLSGGPKALEEALKQHSAYLPGGTGRPAIAVDEAGNASITGATSGYMQLTVDGKPVAPGQIVPLRAGESVQLKSDIGDRYPIYEIRDLLWSRTLDGTLVLGGSELKAGAAFDYLVREFGTKVLTPGK